MPKPEEDLAGRLYTVYCRAVGGKAFNGDTLPDWKEFSVDLNKLAQSNAWRAVAREAIAAETGVVSAPCEPIGKGKPFKRPEGMFWLHVDIGKGKCWNLCRIEDIARPGGQHTSLSIVRFLVSDYTDYWHDEDWLPEQIVEIETPKHEPQTT